VVVVGEMDLRRRLRGRGGGAMNGDRSGSDERCSGGDRRRVVMMVDVNRKRGLRWWWREMRRRLRG